MTNDTSERVSDQRTFENYQRILSDTASAKMTLMTQTLSFQSAGLVGLYQLLTATNIDTILTIRILSIIMLCITCIITLVWYREHNLFEECIKDLKIMSVGFPDTRESLKGTTGWMWRIIHTLSAILWALTLVFAQHLDLSKQAQ